MLNLKARAEFVICPVAVVHYKVGTLPVTGEIEVALCLAQVDVFVLEQAETHQSIRGAAPAAEDRAT